MNRKASMLTKAIGWGALFLIIIFATPVLWETIFVSNPGGIEGFIAKIAPWVLLLVLIGKGWKILKSGDSVT